MLRIVSQYYELDVFYNTFCGGNDLGTVMDAGKWSKRDMQAFAKKTKLVETTFVTPKSESDLLYFKVNIFMVDKEIEFAAHPIIGTAHAILDHYGSHVMQNEELILECGNKKIPVRQLKSSNSIDRVLQLKSPIASVSDLVMEKSIFDNVFNNIANKSGLNPKLVIGGRKWWIVQLDSENTLRNWNLNCEDYDAIRQLSNATGTMGLCVFSVSNSSDQLYDIVVRAFPLGVGIKEDPASGAANALIASYIKSECPHIIKYNDATSSYSYVVSQGREMNCDARLHINIEDDEIWVGGTSEIIIDGKVKWQPICNE